MSTESDRNDRLIKFARDRALVIAISNALLIGFSYWALQEWTAFDASSFFWLEAVVVVGCLVVNWDFGAKMLSEVAQTLSRSLKSDSEEGVPETTPQAVDPNRVTLRDRRYSGFVLFGVLLPLIVLNFVAIGLLIQGTGGFTASPFAQFAVALVLLGQLMAYEKLTQAVIVVLGLAYVGILLLWWDPTSKVLPDDSVMSHQFFAASFLSLLISSVTNYFARPARRVAQPELNPPSAAPAAGLNAQLLELSSEEAARHQRILDRYPALRDGELLTTEELDGLTPQQQALYRRLYLGGTEE